MSVNPRRRNPFFSLAAFFSALFILTIFALVAVVFSDAPSPATQFFDRHASKLLAVEVGAILISGYVALALDRRQTLAAQPTETDSPHEQVDSGRDQTPA